VGAAMTSGLRARAWLALGIFIGGLALPIVSPAHPVDDDQDTPGVALISHHPWSEIASVLPPAVPQHCAICHWERALSGASASARVEVASALHAIAVGRLEIRLSADSAPIRHGSSRAPPSPVLA
jgi:hypothetical protein